MAKKATNSKAQVDRVRIIETVQTPLGFFVLVVLVVEAILGMVAGLTDRANQVIVISGMLAIISALIVVVAFLAYYRPEALKGMRPPDNKITDPLVQGHAAIEKHKVNQIISVSTPDYDGLGIEKDEAILKLHYGSVVSLRKASLSDFRKQLSTNRFDIVHFLGFVHPQTGELKFSETESLSPNGMLKLLELCGAKLAFLATCDSVFLAARLAPKVNVVAASGNVETERMVIWEECFYELLARGHSLSEAYAVAQETTDVPMVLLMKRDSILVSNQIGSKGS